MLGSGHVHQVLLAPPQTDVWNSHYPTQNPSSSQIVYALGPLKLPGPILNPHIEQTMLTLLAGPQTLA